MDIPNFAIEGIGKGLANFAPILAPPTKPAKPAVCFNISLLKPPSNEPGSKVSPCGPTAKS